ncbi:ArnT family glycosyltransferase [Bradyrhizobium erythrophlei]|uniref:4-amino-4-deoxy-L-arabinose transferase n=1 Tax=Bradyrhizobium erythrophlei TaxID=1437360 RepID=A0A1H4UKC7_9BRAD|nr:glycosyltransferase family 39 protein [Bradyrhizobium erythrophlei]SEC68584.1 4-amino-4-deoxy-L-arabinose transferase [Bradyrhizobium erythrophlei]
MPDVSRSNTLVASARGLRPLRALTALFEFAVGSHRRAALVLLLTSLITFLPGVFEIPPIDRDEAYLSQSSKEMMEGGDYVDLRYQHDTHYTKPVGIHWLQVAAVRTAEAFGVPDARTAIWLYRLPSVLAGIGAVLVTYWCALAFVSRRGAMLAGLMIVGSPLIDAEARLARTDAVLLLTITAAMSVLARAYLFGRDEKIARPGWTLVLVFWIAFAAGILLKGLVIVMVVGLTAATLCVVERSARWLQILRPLHGIIFLAILVLPWLIAMYARTGDSFLLQSVGHDTLGKITTAQESHGGPPGYYLVLFFATFFPTSVLVGLAAPAIWARRREADIRYLLAWLVPSWVIFELSATKLPHYVMPLYPAIAILVAGAIEAKTLSRQRWLIKLGVTWWYIAPTIIGLAAVFAAVALVRRPILLAWPLVVAAIVCGYLAREIYGRSVESAVTHAIAAMILVGVAFFGLIAPALSPLFPSATLAELVRASGCPNPAAASAGYWEPSLVFLLGTQTKFVTAPAAADFLHAAGCRFAFVDTHQEREFLERAKAIGLRYAWGPEIGAFNYSKGQAITIAVFSSPDAQSR